MYLKMREGALEVNIKSYERNSRTKHTRPAPTVNPPGSYAQFDHINLKQFHIINTQKQFMFIKETEFNVIVR